MGPEVEHVVHGDADGIWRKDDTAGCHCAPRPVDTAPRGAGPLLGLNAGETCPARPDSLPSPLPWTLRSQRIQLTFFSFFFFFWQGGVGGGVNFTDTMSAEDGQNPELQPCAQVTRHRRSRTSWQGASRPGRPCGPRSVTACTAGGRPRVSPAQDGVAGRPRGGTRPAVPAAAGCALVWPCCAAPTAGGRLGHVQVGTALRCRREHPRTLPGARVCAPRLGVEGVRGGRLEGESVLGCR